MDTILKNKIKDKLSKFLNRQPSDDEIINAQNDIVIMGKIRDDEYDTLKAENTSLKIEIDKLKTKNVL